MRICVSGGDVIGLIAAHLCRLRGHSVVLVERNTLGREALSSRFKFLERSQEVLALLDGLGVVYAEYTLATGLLERGSVKTCPRRVSEGIHYAHWRKTRLTSMPIGSHGLCDPEVTSRRYALSLDWRDFVRRLSQGVSVQSRLLGSADVVFETLPMWESKFVRHETARDAMAVALHLVPVRARASKDRYMKWDLVYTPHTPGNAIHRFYHSDDYGYVCEYSGELSQTSVASDLNYLFPDGWCLDGTVETVHGKLVSLHDAPQWPAHVCPLGRMAQWDETASVTRAIRTILEKVPDAHA